LHQDPDGLEVGIGKLLEFAKQGDVLLVLVGRVRVLADQIGGSSIARLGGRASRRSGARSTNGAKRFWLKRMPQSRL
jgi:hypothetical protein